VLVYAMQATLLWCAAEAITIRNETCKLGLVSDESSKCALDVPVYIQPIHKASVISSSWVYHGEDNALSSCYLPFSRPGHVWRR